MKWKTEQILDAVRRGEDSDIEFKEVYFSGGNKVTAPRPDHIAKELEAFANANGGILIFGINDKSREILGVAEENLDLFEQWVQQICNDKVKPGLPINLYRREIPVDAERVVTVLIAEVEKGIYVHEAPDGFFRRSGSSARPMDTDYVVRLDQRRSLSGIKRFEQLPMPQSAPQDLQPQLYRNFVSSLEEDTQTALRKRHLLVRNSDGEIRASVAGVLMATDDPREFFPNAYIQAVRYRGTVRDSNFQTDAKEITGPLNRQILDAMAFFRLNSRIAATKELDRHDQSAFSERAVFEAVVNAVAHRDYSMETMKIRFHIFDDRLLIASPGSLVNSMTVDSLGLMTATRNELLTNFLRECGLGDDDQTRYGRGSLMERRGDGVGIIMRESVELSGKTPEYRLVDDMELQLTIHAAELPNQEGAS